MSGSATRGRSRRASASPPRTRTSSSAVGFTHRKAEYAVGLARSELDLAALARSGRRRGPRAHHRAARARPLDGGVVPRTPPRPPASVARGRPGAAQGCPGPLRCRGDRARRPPRSVPESLRPLPPDGSADHTVTIRRATLADESILRQFFEDFEREHPVPRRRARDVGRRVEGHPRRPGHRRRLRRRGRAGAGRRRPRRGAVARHRARAPRPRPTARTAAGNRKGIAQGVRRRRTESRRTAPEPRGAARERRGSRPPGAGSASRTCGSA